MRPLSHLGVGANSADYELYNIDEKLYDELHERTNRLLDEACAAFMGEYAEEPTLTKKELDGLLETTLKEKNHLIKLRASNDIIAGYDKSIVEIYNLIKTKQYASASDPAYKQYCKNRESRYASWQQSKELADLLDEIRQYNEDAFNKAKQETARNELV